jgi:hypothetical protein
MNIESTMRSVNTSILLLFELLLVLFQLVSEHLHEDLLLLPLLLSQLPLRRHNHLLRGGFLFDCLVGTRVEVVVYELQDEILVLVEGLNVAVQFKKMSSHLVLQIVEFSYLFH